MAVALHQQNVIIAGIRAGFSALALLLSTLRTVGQDSQVSNLYLSANEGSRIYIPCFNSEKNIALWQFNNSLYPVGNLPSALYLQKSSNGILILNVTMNISGFTFTCYCYKEKYNLQHVSAVQLIVHEKSESTHSGMINS